MNGAKRKETILCCSKRQLQVDDFSTLLFRLHLPHVPTFGTGELRSHRQEEVRRWLLPLVRTPTLKRIL